MTFPSRRERKGPAPQAWEGEGIRPLRLDPSPSRRDRDGPLPLPLGEEKTEPA